MRGALLILAAAAAGARAAPQTQLYQLPPPVQGAQSDSQRSYNELEGYQETTITPQQPQQIFTELESEQPPPPNQSLLSQVNLASTPLITSVFSGSGQLPNRYTRLEYEPNMLHNVNPGSGESGQLGVFVGTCAASTVCVPQAMCNPYTGFVRGGLLFEPTGPSNMPTVAMLRCYRLKDGGIGDGVCCQMPHINDPWPDFQQQGRN